MASGHPASKRWNIPTKIRSTAQMSRREKTTNLLHSLRKKQEQDESTAAAANDMKIYFRFLHFLSE
jgi:hypothetical protein